MDTAHRPWRRVAAGAGLGCLLAAIVVPAFAGAAFLQGGERGAHRAPRATHASATSAAEVGASVAPSMARGVGGRLLTEVARVRVGPFPVALAVAERQGHVFVLNQDPRETSRGSVSMLESRTGRVLGVAPVGRGARALAVDEGANRVFVLNAGPADPTGVQLGPNSVSVLDATTGRVLATTPVGRDGDEVGALLVDARRVRVLVSLPSALDILAVASGAPLGAIALPRDLAFTHEAGELVFDPASGALFVGEGTGGGGCPLPPLRRGSYSAVVCVAQLDGATGWVRARIPIPSNDTLPQVVSGLADDSVAGRVVVYFADGHGGGYVAALAATMPQASSAADAPALAVDALRGRTLVVTRPSSYEGPGPFTASVFETRGGALRGSVDVSEVGGLGRSSSEYAALPDAAVDGRTGHAFVVTGAFLPAAHAYGPSQSPRPNVVTVLDLARVKILGALAVGRGQPALVLDERTRRVFVANSADGTVSVLSIS